MMKLPWKIEWDARAVKELRKISKTDQKRIINYLKKRVLNSENPKSMGKALTSNFSGIWRYRVSDYRILCNIEADKMTILVISVGHRSSIY